eukprot:4972569-Amphidinium_carterae.1
MYLFGQTHKRIVIVGGLGGKDLRWGVVLCWECMTPPRFDHRAIRGGGMGNWQKRLTCKTVDKFQWQLSQTLEPS